MNLIKLKNLKRFNHFSSEGGGQITFTYKIFNLEYVIVDINSLTDATTYTRTCAVLASGRHMFTSKKYIQSSQKICTKSIRIKIYKRSMSYRNRFVR